MLEKLNGFQIFVTTELIGTPFAVLFTVIQIQHGCHGIDSHTVDMELTQPEQHVGNQEVLYLRLAVIENFGTPLRMLAFTGIGILKNAGAVKAAQTECIGCKVGGYPV